MADGEFLQPIKTPGRDSISLEVDYQSEHFEQIRAASDFEDYLYQAEKLSIPSEIAAVALKNCSGDYRLALSSLQMNTLE